MESYVQLKVLFFQSDSSTTYLLSKMRPVGCDRPASVPNSNLAGACYLKIEQLFLFTFLFGYRNLPAKIGVGHK